MIGWPWFAALYAAAGLLFQGLALEGERGVSWRGRTAVAVLWLPVAAVAVVAYWVRMVKR